MLPHNEKEPEPESITPCLYNAEKQHHTTEVDAPPDTVAVDSWKESTEIHASLYALYEAMSRRRTLKYIFSNPIRNAGVITGCLFLMLAMQSLGVIIFGMLFFIGGGVILSLSDSNTAIRDAIDGLATTEDLRLIGLLAELLVWWDPNYSNAAATLSRLLPRLQASDRDLLSDRQLFCLRRALKQNTNRLLFWHNDPIFAGILRQTLTTLDALPSEEQSEEKELLELSVSPTEPLFRSFQAAVRQRRQNTVTMSAAAALAAGSAIANLFQQANHSQDFTLLWIAVGALGVTFGLSFRGLFRLKGLMNNLANISDLRIAGPLVEIVALEESIANKMAAQLLTRLLPRFRASDAKLLTDGQHTALLRTLNRTNATPEYFVAVLKALEQIGDARALPVVESLATGRRATIAPRRVQAAAQDCLPFLRVRCDQQRASQTLLRASDAAGMQTDTLLRPAQGGGTTEATELLRPGTSQSGDA